MNVSAYTPYLELSPGADLTLPTTSWSWSDYTDRVWMRDKIVRTWGRPNRFPGTSPARLAWTFTNDDGLFVPDNALSALYGLIDQNTPARLLVAPGEHTASDAFGRTTASSWGSADVGGAWSNAAVAGASAFSVSPSSGGRHTHPTAGDIHWSTLGSVSLQRVDLQVRVRVNALSTGAAQSVALVCRYTGVGDNRRGEVQFGTTGTLTARVVGWNASVQTVYGSTPVTGLTHSAAAWYRIRLQAMGTSARLKVWLDGTTEPRTWNITGTGSGFPGPVDGAVGLFSLRETGNTNASATVDFDDFSMVDGPYVLQTCFVDEWPADFTDLTGNQALAKITASGRLRQLQNTRPLRSALYREFSRDSTVVAYWPLEDRSGATSFAGWPSLPATTFTDVSPGSDSTVLGSEPLPSFGGQSHVYFTPPTYTAANSWSLRFTCKMPQSPTVAGQLLSWFTRASTVARWQITILAGTPDTLRIDAYGWNGFISSSATLPLTDITSGAELTDGRQLYIEVDATQNGTGTDIDIDVWYTPDDGSGGTAGGMLVNFPSTVPTNIDGIYFDGNNGWGFGGVVLGHIAIGPTSIGPTFDGVTGYAGELTNTRLLRLCSAENISSDFGEIFGAGAGSSTQRMGPQGIKSLYGHLQQIESTESGILFDGPLGDVTILPRSQRYNHAVDLVLDVDQGHVGWPIRRTLDDQLLVNEVTAARPSGSSQTASDEALIAKLGYRPQTVEVNSYRDSELINHAQWWLSQGTSRKARYPQVPLVLHRNPGLIRDYLEMSNGGRIQIVNSPGPLPPDTLDLIAEGGTDTIDPFEWRAMINASDGAQWITGKLDDGVSPWDCGATTTNEALDTTETGVDVAIADTCTWVHTVDYDIFIGGERMTVTNVSAAVGSGSSWTQTLTVIRSKNGVVKSHSTGASVRAAAPQRWAL